MTISITAYRNRSFEFSVTVTDNNGDVAPFQVDQDLMRLKIGEAAETPLLDLTNIVPATKASFMTPRNNPCTLNLAQADLAVITAGIYELEVAIVDASDSNKIKHADKGIFTLLDTQLGDVGVTEP